MCLHVDVRFFFQRLDDGGGVLFPEAKRNGRFEIFSHSAQSRGYCKLSANFSKQFRERVKTHEQQGES